MTYPGNRAIVHGCSLCKNTKEQEVGTTDKSEEAKLFHEIVGSIFALLNEREARRVSQGREALTGSKKSERYALRRLYYTVIDGTVYEVGLPRMAMEGFRWCGVGEVSAETNAQELEIPGFSYNYGKQYAARIQLKSLDEVFLIDQYESLETRASYVRQVKEEGRVWLKKEEAARVEHLRAKTLVSALSYVKMGLSYRQIVVLIGRSLDFAEVELVTDPEE